MAKDAQKAQANYKGKNLREVVKIEITKDSKYYKKGDTDTVHQATAELLKSKGLEFKEVK
jgi:uncharacterized protein YjdB